MALESVYQTLMDNFMLYVAVTLALVAFIKEAFSLAGGAVRFVSFLVGILIAGVFYIGYLFPEYAVYVEGLFFILTIGLIASGAYDFVKDVRY